MDQPRSSLVLQAGGVMVSNFQKKCYITHEWPPKWSNALHQHSEQVYKFSDTSDGPVPGRDRHIGQLLADVFPFPRTCQGATD